METMLPMLWAITVVATVVAAFIAMWSIVGATGAPQQAAGAAVALCVAVIPYIFTRCFERIGNAGWQRKMLEALQKRDGK